MPKVKIRFGGKRVMKENSRFEAVPVLIEFLRSNVLIGK
jgi:hypothetical protein